MLAYGTEKRATMDRNWSSWLSRHSDGKTIGGSLITFTGRAGNARTARTANGRTYAFTRDADGWPAEVIILPPESYYELFTS